MKEIGSIPGQQPGRSSIPGRFRHASGLLSRFFRTSPIGAVAAAFLAFLILLAIFANVIVPNDPLETFPSFFRKGPSMERPLGSDHLGRDVLSRVIVGSRTSLYVAVLAVSISKLIGFSWGILTGYAGGKFDLISQRFLDILMSFPGIILAMLLLVGVGSGLYTVIAAIAITGVAGTTRVIRSVTLTVREMEYVEAGRALGASPLRIMFVHITPQCIAPLMVLASVSLGGAIFAEAALSFLGLGIPPPNPSLGNMLGGVLGDAFKPPWWLVFYPGITITLTILAFNIFGDGMRDHLDPRLRGRLN